MKTKILCLFCFVLWNKEFCKAQPLVNCSKLWLNQDTFYLMYGQNTHVIADLHYKDTTMVVYPVLRLLLQDTSVVKPLNQIYLSFLANPQDTMEQFNFNMQFKSQNFASGTVVKGLFHIYDSDTPGDSIATCYFPIVLVLQNPASVGEERDNQQVKIYPNPARQTLFLDFKQTTPGDFLFQLYDLRGENVFEESVRSSPGKKQIQLPQLEKGLYFYRVFSEKGLSARGKLLIGR